jgi:hypothetical protein
MTTEDVSDFELSPAQEKWAKRGRQGAAPIELRRMLKKQKGRCALSKVLLMFGAQHHGTREKNGRGCHPLYPAVDHKDPGNPNGGYQIVCYALNDLKGHLPTECFKALRSTKAWKSLMQEWRAKAETGPKKREKFERLVRPNANKGKASPSVGKGGRK